MRKAFWYLFPTFWTLCQFGLTTQSYRPSKVGFATAVRKASLHVNVKLG